MNIDVLVFHYRESQDAFWQSWNFLCRSYLLLRRINPLLGDGIAVLGGVVGLLVALEVFTLVSRVFSEKYVAAACNFKKGICKIMRWLFHQIQKIFHLVTALLRVLKRLKRNSFDVSSNPIASDFVPTQSQKINREQLAIESRTLLLEVLGTDARHRTVMRCLLREVDTKLQLLGCSAHASLVEKAMTQPKGTTIKQYAQSILLMSKL